MSTESSTAIIVDSTDVRPRGAVTWSERCFDLALTIVALPLIVLIAGAIAIAIYLDSPGPVLYRSRRVGSHGEPFEMLKFRKMRREAPSHPVTLDVDDRFTPIGRFLADSRLDELPQVVNVLRGEMRLVGPRPELQYFTDQFAVEYREILTVAPGITGNAQLRFVNEKSLLRGISPAVTYAEEVLPAKIRIDLDYVRFHSLAADLSILAGTVALPWRLLLRRWRRHSPAIRVWIPSAAAAALLALAFIVTSRGMP